MGERRQLIQRFKEFAILYSKSRLGVAGLTLLVFFIAIAVLAPLLTPYDPQYTMQLANFRAKPEWLYTSLPRNIYYLKDYGFTTSSSLNEWNISNDNIVSWSAYEGSPGIPLVEEGSGPGSIEFSFKNKEGVANTTIEKRFLYS